RLCQRRKREHRRVTLAAPPVEIALVELGPRGADDKERDAATPPDQMVQKRQQRGVRPVDVLEDQHEWRPRCDRLEEATPRRKQLLPVRRLRPLRADEAAEPRDEPPPALAVPADA